MLERWWPSYQTTNRSSDDDDEELGRLRVPASRVSYLESSDLYGSVRLESLRSSPLPRASSVASELSIGPDEVHSIRFQVVVWYIGPVDAVLGKVDMRFRVTIFWNIAEDDDAQIGYGMHNPRHKTVWAMYGRQRAYQKELDDIGDSKLVYVPPVSILNAVDFDVLGEPEVCCVDAERKLMRWSCLYKASMAQEHLHVGAFPHDAHDLVLRLGILKHRQNRKRWDRRRWRLGLAGEEDVQDTIKVPHGLVVDHVRVPGFGYRPKGLRFDIVPMEFGGDTEDMLPDQCLEVKLRVERDSSYYDRNIIPLLAALNIVAISTLALEAAKFGSRGEILLAIAFVEMGVRLTLDSRLPIVGYQIKMQHVLNHFFFAVLALTLESSANYLLLQLTGRVAWTELVDLCMAGLSVLHLVWILCYYFHGKQPFVRIYAV